MIDVKQVQLSYKLCLFFFKFYIMNKKLKRNKNQSIQSNGPHHLYMREEISLSKRIKKLEKALRELVSEMRDVNQINKYQGILDEGVLKYKGFRKTSPYRGVSYFKPQGLWRSRLYADGKPHLTYHKTEIEAAQAYDQKVLKHYPERLHYLNFVPDSMTQEEVCRPKKMNAHQKRIFVSKNLSRAEIKAINPLGLAYFKVRDSDVAIRYIEMKKDKHDK